MAAQRLLIPSYCCVSASSSCSLFFPLRLLCRLYDDDDDSVRAHDPGVLFNVSRPDPSLHRSAVGKNCATTAAAAAVFRALLAAARQPVACFFVVHELYCKGQALSPRIQAFCWYTTTRPPSFQEERDSSDAFQRLQVVSSLRRTKSRTL